MHWHGHGFVNFTDEEFPAVANKEHFFIPESVLEQKFSLNLLIFFVPAIINVIKIPVMVDKYSNPIVFQLFMMFLYKMFKEDTVGEFPYQCLVFFGNF